MENLNMDVQTADNVRRATNGPRFLIPENEYGYDHPDVVFWTNHLLREARKRNVFANIKATLKTKRSLAAAETMATAWYDFTRFVPIFLTKAVAQTDDPERQHHLIQIAYDELGGRDKDLIHSELFLEAIEKAGVKVVPCSCGSSIKEILRVLDKALVNTQSQYGIMGLLMSFEIIAEENIETLFDGLCHEASSKDALSESRFFQIHRADETEHIRHSIANFLRFCKTDTQREEFKRSFDEGVDFWHRFWDQCARMINLEADLRVSA